MLLKLDGKGPMYRQLSRALQGALRNGRLTPGARLPSTRELAGDLQLSRNTVRAAYVQLADEGVVVCRHGSGSYASLPNAGPASVPPNAPLPPQSRYSERLRTLGDLGVGQLHKGLRFNLQYGEPLTDALLPDVWRRELARAAAYTALGYPLSQGLPELRSEVAAYLRRRRGMSVTPEDIVIVAGTQQALSLAARVLLDEGDSAVMEDPGYFAARWVLQAHGARVVPVPVDHSGLITDKLPARRPGLIYTTPAHQFPLGAVMSQRRRTDLLRYARRTETWIVEDDYDGEVSFDAPQPAPPLYTMDSGDRVIHVGSFSKVLAPSLRLAYVVAPKALQNDFTMAKRLCDFGCSAIEQASLAHLLKSGGFHRHLRRVIQALRERRDALIDGLEQYGRGHFSFETPSSGMHLVAWRAPKSRLDLDLLVRRCAEVGVGLHPLHRHYMAGPRPAALLMGYAGLSATEIEMACRLLGSCLEGPTARS